MRTASTSPRILRNSDGFVFVVEAGRHGIDEVSLRFTPLRGEVFVALWHTHGARGLHRELFSPTDTALVKRMRVPFYLTDPKGVLRVFGQAIECEHRRATVQPCERRPAPRRAPYWQRTSWQREAAHRRSREASDDAEVTAIARPFAPP